MTAVTMIVGRDAAHLITDASFYDTAGIVRQFRSKVTVAQPFRMAIACSGCVERRQVAIRLEAVRSQAEALAKLPDVVTGIRSENAVARPGEEASGYNDLLLYAAIWSDVTDRPEGWVVSSSRAFLGEAYTPFTLVEVERVGSPPSSIAGQPFTDPVVHARRVLEEQRAWVETDGATIVCGWGELTSVTAAGIRQERVIEWPDELGWRIWAGGGVS